MVLSKIDVMTATQDDIITFLNHLKKPESEDPLHKWIGTYNNYLQIFKKFFKWFNNPYCMVGLRQLRRKEKSIYKPSDLWTQEDDMIFLKFCPSKRDRCYHMMARDSSCRPSELLRLKVKDIVFKLAGDNNIQYAEILVNGKTGSRTIPLIDSLPYVKDHLDDHTPDPNSYVFRSAKTLRNISSQTVTNMYNDYKKKYFPRLLRLKDDTVGREDKEAIKSLLTKPWNPYIQRHTSLTQKSKFLKESVLRNHAGWTNTSDMPDKYLHYFGNESNESILEAYGLKTKAMQLDKLRPKQCPNCSESCKVDDRFCPKCRMVLSYDSYVEAINEKEQYTDIFDELRTRMASLEEKFNKSP